MSRLPSATSAPSSPTAWLRLSHFTSVPHTSIPCPTHPYTFTPSLYKTSKTAPPPGHHKLLSLSPIGSLGRRVRAQRFHSVPRRANGNWGSLFQFPPASYIIWNFQTADYWACHLLSRWYLARLVLPWRWRRYARPNRRLTFNGLHGVISQKIVLFITTGVKNLDPTKFTSFAFWPIPTYTTILEHWRVVRQRTSCRFILYLSRYVAFKLRNMFQDFLMLIL
jgi:hypothetical protein